MTRTCPQTLAALHAVCLLFLLLSTTPFASSSDPTAVTSGNNNDSMVTIGINHSYPSPSTFDAGLDPALGRQIQYVAPGGTAAQLGVRPGDVITGINGIPVTNGMTIRHELMVSDNGDPINLTVWRNGQEINFNGTITPGEASWRHGEFDDTTLAREKAYRERQRQRLDNKLENFYDDYNEIQDLKQELDELQKELSETKDLTNIKTGSGSVNNENPYSSPGWILHWHSHGIGNTL